MKVSENSIVIIIQARVGSSRLPGKVLKKIGNFTVVELLAKRLLEHYPNEKIYFAVPDTSQDNELVSHLTLMGVNVFRGSENDVYARLKGALINQSCDAFVRLTADCPLTSMEFLKAAIQFYFASEYDVVHSGPKMAEGLDFEIINKKKFLDLERNNLLPIQREHPTLYFYENKSNYKIYDFEPSEKDESSFRITLDEPQDFLVLQSIANYFQDNLVKVDWKEIQEFLKANEHIQKLNNYIERNEGLRCDREKGTKNE